MNPTTFVHLHVLQVLHGPVERLPHDLVPVHRVVPVLHSQEVVIAVGPEKDKKTSKSVKSLWESGKPNFWGARVV